MAITLDLMPLEEKLPEAPPPRTLVVKYGYLRNIGEFQSDIPSKVGCGTKVVMRTDRGTEIGEVLTTTCGNGGCGKSITRDKMLAYIENSGGKDYPFTEAGRVLRVATTQDLAEQAKLDEQKKKHLTLAKEMVAKHHLGIKMVEVEYPLGGERVLFYFLSENRVDFRALVRDLAHELRTRIELRQVGARDEARLTADYEKCGQHCCCKQFLKVLTPISMRAAKVQKATLDPSKISGRCGRLMCCLRYEDETYEELRKKLPKRNTRVRTEKGEGWVVDGQILTQLVLVMYDDYKREAVPMEKILAFDCPKPVLPDGRTMQSPNDRPPEMREERPQRGGPRPQGRGPGPVQRPKPGAPVQAPEGDPLAATGPTGGDLNTGADPIDELMADALDDGAKPAPTAEAPAITPPSQATPPQQQQQPQQRRPQQQQRPIQQPQRGPKPGRQSFAPQLGPLKLRPLTPKPPRNAPPGQGQQPPAAAASEAPPPPPASPAPQAQEATPPAPPADQPPA